jgi:uncharacterized protein YciI
MHPPRDDLIATMTDAERSAFDAYAGWLHKLLADGMLIVAGPCLGQVNTGIAIFEAPDEQTARRIVASEPVTSGGYMSGDLRPYRLGLLRARDRQPEEGGDDVTVRERVPGVPHEVQRAPALPGGVDQGGPQLVAVPPDVEDLQPAPAGPGPRIAVPAGYAHPDRTRGQVAELQQVVVQLLVAARQHRVIQAPLDARGERAGQQHVGIEGHDHAFGEADGPLEFPQHRSQATVQPRGRPAGSAGRFGHDLYAIRSPPGQAWEPRQAYASCPRT